MSTKHFVGTTYTHTVPVSAGDVLLHELFDRACAAWPSVPALDIPPGSGRLRRQVATYAELNAATHAIEALLRPIARPDSVMATLLPRTTIEAFAAPIGILRAGSAFTCIDTAFPDVRITDLIDDSQAVAILTDADGHDRLLRLGIDSDCIIRLEDTIPREGLPTTELPSPTGTHRPEGLTSASLAYLIYTSGTTGKPKGVMIEHRAVVNLIASDLVEFGAGPDDRIAQNSSHAYDSSIEETWMALAAGATLVVMDDDVARSGPDLVPFLDRESISVLCPTPTMLRATGCRTGEGLLPRLRLLYVGGEAMTPDVIGVWAPGRRMVNGYGPTESTVTSVRTELRAGEPVTIGRPVPHVTARVLADDATEAADETPGELCLGGAGLARGYWRDPDLTARKFPLHPEFGRLYRTGDLATRAADGTLTCLGRVDSQVKIRGYRIELQEIETRLEACDGVRGAACRVQVEGPRSTLVGFVVPVDAASPPDLGHIHRTLSRTLPSHLVPAHLRVIDALPVMPSGKLNRAALPLIADDGARESAVLPHTPMEARIEIALRRATGRTAPISITANFFEDLGGDSLLAAQLITVLRADPDTAALTVRDAYAEPTIERLARKAAGLVEIRIPPRPLPARGGRPMLATVLQLGWLGVEIIAGGAAGYLAVTWLWSLAFSESRMAIATVLPIVGVAALLLYIPVSIAIAVLVKRILIGRYRPGSWPVWGSYYVRHWVVCQVLRIVPWRFLEGTLFQLAALRALGARIGRRVHIHRGVDLLQGGWDLLEVGDDVMIGQEATIRLVDLADEQLYAGTVRIESGATIETRASIAGDAAIGRGGYLTALSSLDTGSVIPPGAKWDGVPAAPAGSAPDTPRLDAGVRELTPAVLDTFMLVSRLVTFMIVPTLMTWAAVTLGATVDEDALLAAPMVWLVFGVSLAIVPVAVVIYALTARVIGRVEPGVISRWSRDYLRVWIKTDMVRRAADWLAGTLMWPMWLRAAGMRVGPDCEISTIIDVVPELVTIGPGTFFADGVYLGGPRLHRGTVTLERTVLGSEVFLGNHVVIPAGSTVADRRADRRVDRRRRTGHARRIGLVRPSAVCTGARAGPGRRVVSSRTIRR